MFGALIGPVSDLLGKVLERAVPDPVQRAAAKAELLKLQQEGATRDLETRMSAIIAEAKSKDKWTSRARPGFLYVMYAMILASIPIGFLGAWQPDIAASVATGMQAWLQAIPQAMWGVFGAGYLGYAGMRTIDKAKRK